MPEPESKLFHREVLLVLAAVFVIISTASSIDMILDKGT